jgi:hypothetical protein
LEMSLDLNVRRLFYKDVLKLLSEMVK